MEAEIVATRHDLILGRCYFTYEWCGPSTATAWLPDKFKDIFQDHSMPWPLMKVERSMSRRAWRVARRDTWLGIPALAWWLRYQVWRVVDDVYYRAIMTLMLWGLAWVEPWEEPSWRNIGRRRLQ